MGIDIVIKNIWDVIGDIVFIVENMLFLPKGEQKPLPYVLSQLWLMVNADSSVAQC